MPPSRAGSTSILQAVEMRGETDARPSYPLYFVLPFVLIIVGAILAVGLAVALAGVPSGGAEATDAAIQQWAEQNVGIILGVVGLFLAAFVAALVIGVIGVYKLIKRRNEHFGRDRLLRQGTIEMCREAGGEDDDVHEHIVAMERLHNEALLEENERSAGLHILISFLTFGLWFYYVLWFLMKDLPRHTRRQARFTRHANEAMAKAGVLDGADDPTDQTPAPDEADPDDQPEPPAGDPSTGPGQGPWPTEPQADRDALPPIDPIEERSFGLYIGLVVLLPLVGSLLATGLGLPEVASTPLDLVGLGATFVFWYWIYTDPNEHLARQWAYEDELIQIAQEPPASKPAASLDQMPTPGSSPGMEGETKDEEDTPAFTVWACGACSKKYKVPPKRPVRVTCKACGNQEILRE